MATPTKGQPFSIRLSGPTDAFVRAEAQRTKRSKSAIVEGLTEEASRMRRFPGIGFRGDDAARRAWVIGTALDVWQIIEARRDFESAEHMAGKTDLILRHILLAEAYRDHHPEVIDTSIAANNLGIDEFRNLYPTFEVFIVR